MCLTLPPGVGSCPWPKIKFQFHHSVWQWGFSFIFQTEITFTPKEPLRGRYVVVLHYRQPEHTSFPVDVRVTTGRVWKGECSGGRDRLPSYQEFTGSGVFLPSQNSQILLPFSQLFIILFWEYCPIIMNHYIGPHRFTITDMCMMVKLKKNCSYIFLLIGRKLWNKNAVFYHYVIAMH